MDIWFIDQYHGKAATGIYSLAVNLSQFFWVLPNAIGSVLYSYIAKDGLENNLQNIQRLTKYTFYFNVVAGLMSVLLLNTLIPLFYGEAFNKRNTIPQRFMRIVTRTPFKNIFYKINIYFNNNKSLNTIDSDIFEEKFDDENSINWGLQAMELYYNNNSSDKICSEISDLTRKLVNIVSTNDMYNYALPRLSQLAMKTNNDNFITNTLNNMRKEKRNNQTIKYCGK
jgi:hypothetical protein